VNALFARVAAYNLSALAFLRPPPLFLVTSLSLLVIHAVGLAIVAQLMRAPLWIVGVVILGLVVAQFIPGVREIVSPALLAPFWFVYALVVLRFVWLRVVGGEIEG